MIFTSVQQLIIIISVYHAQFFFFFSWLCHVQKNIPPLTWIPFPKSNLIKNNNYFTLICPFTAFDNYYLSILLSDFAFSFFHIYATMENYLQTELIYDSSGFNNLLNCVYRRHSKLCDILKIKSN